MTDQLSERPYAAPLEGFDETYNIDGTPRIHWQAFTRSFEEIGEQEHSKRWDSARRMMHEHGITYDIFGDPEGLERPFVLDPIPNMISPDEWSMLEAAVSQRATMYNLMLRDIFGPRRLLKKSIIPPASLFGHPDFDRTCIDLLPDGDRHLQLYAADLCRGADGAWRFLDDRTEAPSGLGYLLENRVIVSHSLEELFRQCQVRRLAPFYATLISELTDTAKRHKENPRVVVLTQGPKASHYFEQAYLARYLGFTLVEPADLTVRDNIVFLKTLGGLKPVDVIFRGISSTSLDPLMQKRDNTAGIPGLIEAIHSRNVSVANALGSGIIEAPIFMPFIQDIYRELLQAEPLLPSISVRWCGDGSSLKEIVDHLEAWWIQPAYEAGAYNMIVGENIEPDKRAALAKQLLSNPDQYVAYQRLPFSTIPVWDKGRYVPKKMILRLYAAATRDGYEVLPGGLTRVAMESTQLVVQKGQGAGSKDTWLKAPGPVAMVSILRKREKEVAINRAIDLPSRVADDLFWLGRYMERTEFQLRLLRSTASRISGETAFETYPELPVLLEALTAHELIEQSVQEAVRYGETAPLASAIVHAVLDKQGTNTLHGAIASAFSAASRVRDRLSIDAWLVVSRIENPPIEHGRGGRFSLTEALDYLSELNFTLAAFSGIAMETMTRGLGWRFVDLGRRLERAYHTALLLRGLITCWEDVSERATLEAILEVAASSMTFRARYRSPIQTGPVLDLLLSDESNPRALAFQVAAVTEHLHALPKEDSVRPYSIPEDRIAVALLTAIRLADPFELATADDSGRRVMLAELLTKVTEDIPALSDHLTLHYMAHVETPRQLVSENGESGR